VGEDQSEELLKDKYGRNTFGFISADSLQKSAESEGTEECVDGGRKIVFKRVRS
jgi:hypothetical protein